MKRDIAQYVANCQICQQVKVEHQKLARLLQPLLALEWKWNHITMDFVIRFSTTRNKKNRVWVIVDYLSKLAHFLAMKTIDFMNSLVKLYIQEIVRFYRIPLSIVSDKDLNLLLSFGRVCKRLWPPNWILTLHFIPNRWLAKESNPDSKRLVEGIHPGLWRELGKLFIFNKVCI